MNQVSIQDMFKAGVHFGHRTRFWNPKMAEFIYGSKENVHVINLDITLSKFKEALGVVKKISANRGKILFVGTKRVCQDIIREEAERCGMPYINKRWLGGLMTNYKTIRVSIKKLAELEKMFSDGTADSFTKKERLSLQRELDKLNASLGGIRHMGGLPDALFVIDVKNEAIAIKEANRLSVPVIGVVDTNCSPEGIDYVIPGNDDAIRAVKYYARLAADAVLDGKAQAEQEAAKVVTKDEESDNKE